MPIPRHSVYTCDQAAGTAVVIDVLRAFSTAAYALAAGAEKIIVVDRVDEAFALREQIPNAFSLGEQKGLPMAGFDFGNSPSEVAGKDLTGKVLIQRTSHGTQGIVRCAQAENRFAASFCCARATARALANFPAARRAFVLTGLESDDPADEDAACADYMEALLTGAEIDLERLRQRVRDSRVGRLFLNQAQPIFPLSDLEYCLAIDCFDFAMPVTRENGLWVITPLYPPDAIISESK